MAVLVEEHTDGRHIGHEEEVDEVDVEGATPNILQRGSYDGQLGEILLIVAEIHEDNGEQSELSDGRGQIGPLQTQLVPLQDVERCPDNQGNNQWIEPLGVHHLLGLIPIAVHDIAIEEEGEMDEHTPQREVVNPLDMLSFVSLCP